MGDLEKGQEVRFKMGARHDVERGNPWIVSRTRSEQYQSTDEGPWKGTP